MKNFERKTVIFLVMLILYANAADNYVAGHNNAFIFEPYYWHWGAQGGDECRDALRGETGQHYYIDRIQISDPPGTWQQYWCEIILDKLSRSPHTIGVVFWEAHGGKDGISAEPFQNDDDGKMLQ